MATRALGRGEIRQKGIVFLCEITFGGRVHRFATHTVSILDGAGVSYLFKGDLEAVDYIDEIDLYSATPSVRTVPVTVRIPDLLAHVRDGHSVDHIRCSIWAWAEGRTMEDRVPLLSGYADSPSVDIDDTLTLTITDDPLDVPPGDTAFPPVEAIIDGDTWPTADGPTTGKTYPIVLGQPWLTGAKVIATTGYGVTTGSAPHKVLVSDGVVDAATVDVYLAGGDTVVKANATVYQTTDGKGRTVSVVDLSDVQANDPTYGQSYIIRWDAGGGIKSPSSAGYLDTAGEMLRFCLQRSGLAVDWGSVAAAEYWLRGIKVAGVWEKRVELLDFLKKDLLPLLPVTVSGGPDGLRVAITDPDKWQSTKQFSFRAGTDGGLSDPPTNERENIVNDYTLRFALGRGEGTYRGISRVHGAADDGQGGSRTAQAVASHSHYGTRGEDVTTSIVYEQGSADAIVSAKVRANALGWTFYTYQAMPEWGAYQAGMTGTLTDPDFGLVNEPVLLRRVQPGLSSCTLEFVVVD